jgi:hypothetical protein
VDRALATLRKIEVQGNIFTDHVGQTIFDALLEVTTEKWLRCHMAVSHVCIHCHALLPIPLSCM